jgi:hypothetical protein
MHKLLPVLQLILFLQTQNLFMLSVLVLVAVVVVAQEIREQRLLLVVVVVLVEDSILR